MNIFVSLSALIVLSIVTSCSYSEFNNDVPLRGRSIENLSFSGTRCLDQSQYKVDETDIDYYISFKEKVTQKDIVVNSVELVKKGGLVVAYAINYDDSWELVSGDKRTPTVLASGKGAFSTTSGNRSFDMWISHLCYSVSSLSKLTELKKIHQNNINHWRLITEDQEYLATIMDVTRSSFGSHLELDRIDTVDVSVSSNHLVSTHWGQSAPFNMFCPLKSNSETQRVPAGCVAIAGAQILNYMYNEFGVPETAPTVASCSGHAPNNYVMSQSGFSSSAWDSISNLDSTVIAALIAYVGKTAQLNYADNGTTGSLYKLRNYVLAPSIWDSVIWDYYDDDYEDIVYNLLLSNLPSIIGVNIFEGTNLDYIGGHAFIIDSYKLAAIDYYYYYNVIEAGQIVSSYEYVESTDPIRYFGMNWGWNGLYDDGWYIAVGPWALNNYNYEFDPIEVITLDEL